ncbi:MAG: hypothetical protein R3253_12150 [Longimicrobiales bacterium]|nr:hypothetical protein [Longimicrobiales bacterium]
MSRLGFAATPAAHGVECGIEVERRARGAVTNLSTGSHLLTQPSRM